MPMKSSGTWRSINQLGMNMLDNYDKIFSLFPVLSFIQFAECCDQYQSELFAEIR